MTKKLEWAVDESGVSFVLRTDDGALPISCWGRSHALSLHETPAHIAPLTSAIERTLADQRDPTTLTLPHEEIELLSETQLQQLGLPPAVPFRLRLRGQGVLTSANFKLEHQLTRHAGQPVMGARRTGAIMSAGREQYTLLFPLYSMLSSIEAFNATAVSDDQETRLLRWASLKELLPESAEVDNQLRSVNVVRADAFTLDTNAIGDIEPVLRHRIAQDPRRDADGNDALDAGSEEPFESALPAEPQKSFAQRFRETAGVKSRYATQGNWYIAMPKVVQRGLEVVKEYQQRPVPERLAFIANPKRIIAAALENEFSAEAIDSVFEETPEFLSQRVRCLGEWQPKAFAYSLPASTRWFPDEHDSGFLIGFGDQLVPVSKKDARDLADRMRTAIDADTSEIEYGAHRIPVSRDSVERLEAMIQAYTNNSASADQREIDNENPKPTLSGQESASDEVGQDRDLRVPLIEDNLHTLGFAYRPHPKRGEAGGLPAILKTTSLYPHQQDGLRWLQEHWACGSNGALLADDMGLGKTIQALSLLAWVQEQQERLGKQRPFLIVAPTGLLRNWEDEEKTHLARPGLGELCYAYGARLKALGAPYDHERRAVFERSGWVMTTYETLRDKIKLFMDVRWSVIVFDEIQKIKNPGTLTHEMAKAVAGDFYLALTGTPVENRVSDLWSVIDTIAPGQLGSLKQFQARYESASDGTSAGWNTQLSDLRHELLERNPPPRVMRRMKADHLRGLPEKHIHRVREMMPAAQAEAYSNVLDSLRKREGDRSSTLTALQHLRRVSLTAANIAEFGINDDQINYSARLKIVFQHLDDIHRAGEKALVFIEYRIIQDHLITYLQRRYAMDQPPGRINGQTNGQQRKKLVDQFQQSAFGEFNIMILSPKAAGVGLTLTAANHVFHLSRWWNPAVEDQCTDRIFRIGQQRTVHVYCPMAIHPSYMDTSFDVNLDALLERKRSLSSGLLTPADASDADLNALLTRSLN